MYYSRTQGVCCCKFCNSRIKDNLTSTGNLIRHMKNAHHDVYEAYKSGNQKAIKCYKQLIQEINNKNKELGMSSDEDADISPKAKKQRSLIWSYFVKGTDMCVCKICATELKNNKNSTGNLIRHIRLKHEDTYKTLRFETDTLTVENTDVNPEVVQDPLAESPQGFKQRSWVWTYFHRDGERCECKICNAKIRIVCGVNFKSTSNLIRHIRRHHYKLYLMHRNKNSDVVDYYKNAVHELDVQCDDDDDDGNDVIHEHFKIIEGKNRRCVRSKVWCYFTRNSVGTMTCKICKKIFITDKLTGTSNLLRHLRVKHGFFKTKTTNNIDKKGSSKSDWVSIYFGELSDNNYRCNVCQAVVHKQYQSDLVEHIQYKHLDIYELHKDGDDEIMGIQIEFLHLNVLKSDEVNTDGVPAIEDGSIKEKKLDRILDCEHNYLVLPEKKALSLGEGRKRSWVWKYFEKLSNYVFRCNICNAALSIKGCNTNNMNRHVRSKHPHIYKMETGKRYCSEQVSDIGSEVEIPELSWPEEADDSKNGGKDYIICEVKRRKPKPRSWIWDYFTRVSGTLAQCKLCSRNICHGGNATGNMNRHMKMLHKDVYVNYVLVAGDDGGVTKTEDEWAWIWKLFTNGEDDYYKCKICMFKLAKSDDLNTSVDSILQHLKSNHGVVSHDQIITSVECGNTVDECTVAVDFLKDSEDI